MLPPGSVTFLEKLSLTHAYGKNASETAAEIIRAEIRRLIVSGDYERIRTTMPEMPIQSNHKDVLDE